MRTVERASVMPLKAYIYRRPHRKHGFYQASTLLFLIGRAPLPRASSYICSWSPDGAALAVCAAGWLLGTLPLLRASGSSSSSTMSLELGFFVQIGRRSQDIIRLVTLIRSLGTAHDEEECWFLSDGSVHPACSPFQGNSSLENLVIFARTSPGGSRLVLLRQPTSPSESGGSMPSTNNLYQTNRRRRLLLLAQ